MNTLLQDVCVCREDFPILKEKINGRELIYFDNAATSQKPECVIQRMDKYYREQNSNIHRGVYDLSKIAEEAFEGAREKIRNYINAESTEEIIFTRGTSDGINLLSSSLGRSLVIGEDEILISEMEHHSNVVPWWLVKNESYNGVLFTPINENGELILDDFNKLLSKRVKLVAITHVSNALGTINPVREIISLAHEKNIPVFLDGAQAMPHMKVDVKELDCDFYAFSGHKMFGPTGIGVLYGKKKFLDRLPPYQGGGDMIKEVTKERITYNKLPNKFEAGTPNIAGAIGLGEAVDYLGKLDWKNITKYEDELLKYATERILTVEGVKIIGTAAKKAGVLSFIIDGLHSYSHDIGSGLNKFGISVRVGHHCAQLVMQKFGVQSTVRASFSFYNTKDEVDFFISALQQVREELCSYILES